MSAIDILHRRVDGFAARGFTSPWGREAQLTASAPGLSGCARTLRGLFRSTTNSVVLSTFRAGAIDGLALAVIEGCYKDEASLVASAAVATALLDKLETPLLAEADIAPALRCALIEAHDRVLALSTEAVEPQVFATLGRPRTTLEGIGASVVAALMLPHRAWLTWVGECQAWLLRDGTARRLNLPHTLAHDPGYRAAAQGDARLDFDFAEGVVTRVLGLTASVPSFDVTRLDLRSADRIVLGNEWLGAHVNTVAGVAGQRAATAVGDELTEAIAAEPAPVPVTVVVAEVE